ncbi:MAG: hypothetical protein U9N56_00215 [Actinomycetota bacterium]|nr:hypothetical protein [Actinomycetota bacterium]
MVLNSTSIAAGVVVAVLGAVPLLLIVVSSQSEEAPQIPTTSIPAVNVAELPKETVFTTPPPQIEGLTESISRVLAVNGFAVEETIEELPPSVIRTLSERDIALTIAEGG